MRESLRLTWSRGIARLSTSVKNWIERRGDLFYDVTSDTPELGSGRRTITQRNPEVRAFLAWTYNH